MRPALAVLVAATALGSARAAQAGDDAFGIVVNHTHVAPTQHRAAVTDSTGVGGEIQISPDEPALISIGGFVALGETDGKRRARDLYDVHFAVGYKLDDGRDDRLVPFAQVGLDFLSITARDGRADQRGTTIGVHAAVGLMGYLGDGWLYRAQAAYLGAIEPGTGDDLASAVLQLGVGRVAW